MVTLISCTKDIVATDTYKLTVGPSAEIHYITSSINKDGDMILDQGISQSNKVELFVKPNTPLTIDVWFSEKYSSQQTAYVPKMVTVYIRKNDVVISKIENVYEYIYQQ